VGLIAHAFHKRTAAIAGTEAMGPSEKNRHNQAGLPWRSPLATSSPGSAVFQSRLHWMHLRVELLEKYFIWQCTWILARQSPCSHSTPCWGEGAAPLCGVVVLVSGCVQGGHGGQGSRLFAVVGPKVTADSVAAKKGKKGMHVDG